MSMKHIVGFSGGIDSQACARWVLERYPKDDVILLNSNAGGNEHPITTEFIEWYSANIHPVVVIQPIVADMAGRGKGMIEKLGLKPDDPLDFGTLAQIKQFFPAKTQQFCTTHLKLEPQRRWMKENIHDDYVRYAGVRREEGKPNAECKGRYYTRIKEWDDYYDCELHHPIADWTKQMCFDYCKHHDGRFNELYTMGFNRVGCAPCVNSNKEDIRNWATRFPEMIDKVREWEKRTGRTFFRPQASSSEWMWIDDIVRWAKTTRGGKQLSMLGDHVDEGCSSKYGICE